MSSGLQEPDRQGRAPPRLQCRKRTLRRTTIRGLKLGGDPTRSKVGGTRDMRPGLLSTTQIGIRGLKLPAPIRRKRCVDRSSNTCRSATSSRTRGTHANIRNVRLSKSRRPSANLDSEASSASTRSNNILFGHGRWEGGKRAGIDPSALRTNFASDRARQDRPRARRQSSGGTFRMGRAESDVQARRTLGKRPGFRFGDYRVRYRRSRSAAWPRA